MPRLKIKSPLAFAWKRKNGKGRLGGEPSFSPCHRKEEKIKCQLLSAKRPQTFLLSVVNLRRQPSHETRL